MKYIKKFFIKLGNAICCYSKVSTKKVNKGIFEDVLVFIRDSKVKIYFFMPDGKIETDTRNNIGEVYANDVIILKPERLGSNAFYVYDLSDKMEPSRIHLKGAVYKFYPIHAMGDDKNSDHFGKIFYIAEMRDGTKTFLKKDLEVIAEDVMSYEVCEVKEKHSCDFIIYYSKDKKFRIYNEYDQTSQGYDFMTRVMEDKTLPLIAINNEEVVGKEYFLICSSYIYKEYTAYKDIRKSNDGYVKVRDANTYKWGYVKLNGNKATDCEFISLSDVVDERFFAKTNGSVHMFDIKGKEYAKPYRLVYENFAERTYGCVKMNLAIVSDYEDDAYFIDYDGNKYKMYEPYEVPEEAYFG